MKLPTLSDLAGLERWKLIAGGIVLVLSLGAGWLHEHDQRVRASALFADRDRAAQQRVAVAEAYAKAANAQVVHDSVRVTRTVHRLDTLWRTVPETLRTSADTQIAIAALPVLRRSTDSAIASCSAFQVSCAEYRRQSDSLITALRDENTLIRDQVRRVTPGKSQTVLRWTERIVIGVVAFKLGQVVR